MNLDNSPFFVKDKWYSITVNPDDPCQFFGKADRLERFTNHLNEKLMRYHKLKIEYLFCIELSEPHVGKYGSKGPRLHTHGIIKFNSNAGLREWLMIEYGNLLNHAIVDIDTISDMDRWIHYCFKQQQIMNKKLLANMEINCPSVESLVSHLRGKSEDLKNLPEATPRTERFDQGSQPDQGPPVEIIPPNHYI